MFKKILIVTLVALLLAGCASAASFKMGLGHTVSIAKSKDATAEAEGTAQVDTVMAAVAVDGNGKILSVLIDNAQVRVKFDAAGKVTSDLAALPKTKKELGDQYGMLAQSQIGKEWYQQIEELEKWMTGKTLAEVKAMKTYQKDDSHPSVPDEADLKTKVTISVESYVFAVEEAINSAK
mgnify:CR=1 FL=1